MMVNIDYYRQIYFNTVKKPPQCIVNFSKTTLGAKKTVHLQPCKDV